VFSLAYWFGADGNWLPLFIFLAEMTVLTLATLRTIFIARGMKYLAPVIGFFEITMWLFAIGEVMKNLSDLRCSFAFAAGFTIGNYLGILFEQRLALGNVVVRIITNKSTITLVQELRNAGFGVTCINGTGAMGPVQVVFTILARRQLTTVTSILKKIDNTMVYTVDSLQEARGGISAPPKKKGPNLVPSALLSPLREWGKVGSVT